MSSYHGWTHRPKAQGGTDPIGPPAPFQAYFRYPMLATPQSITSADTWTTLTMSRAFHQNIDFATGIPPVLLDGSSGITGSGTDFTFSEPMEGGPTTTATWSLWEIGIQVEWLLDGVFVDNLEGDTDMELACRLIRVNSSGVPLQTAKRVHPAAAGPSGSPNALEVISDVNVRTEVTAWIDSPNGERQARAEFDGGSGPDELRLQVRHTVTKETGSNDVRVAGTGALFWGIRHYRGAAP